MTKFGKLSTDPRIEVAESPRYRRRAVGLRACGLLVLAVGICACGPAPRLTSPYADFNNPLQAYLTALPDSNGALQPAVEVSLPRRALVFYRQDDRITGGVEVAVVAERDDRQVGGAVRTRTLTPASWPETTSDSLLVCAVPLDLPDDQALDLRVRVRSIGSQRTWERRLTYRPGQLTALPFLFKDFAWNLGAGGRLDADTDSLQVTVTILAARAGAEMAAADRARLGVRLTGLGGFSKKLETPVAVPTAANEPIVGRFAFAASTLPFGHLQLTPYLATSPGTSRVVRTWSPSRRVSNHHVAVDDDEVWEQQITWLEGKVPEDDLRKLEAISPPRRAAWRDFWNATEPGPGLSDATTDALTRHLDLILSADERFGGAQRGAETDRGRAWIRYGQPDEITHVGDQRGGQRNWEQWYYRRLGLRLTFLDAHGLGDFRLMEAVVP